MVFHLHCPWEGLRQWLPFQPQMGSPLTRGCVTRNRPVGVPMTEDPTPLCGRDGGCPAVRATRLKEAHGQLRSPMSRVPPTSGITQFRLLCDQRHHIFFVKRATNDSPPPLISGTSVSFYVDQQWQANSAHLLQEVDFAGSITNTNSQKQL